MLIGFTFKNFMSFNDETTFSMQSSSGDSKFLELNTFQAGKENLIKSALIFGSNASGKTNFIRGIHAMKSIVLADLNLQKTLIAGIMPFLFSTKSEQTPISFEVVFIAGGTQYEYGFEILHGDVHKEYLYRKDKRRTEMFRRTSPDFRNIKLMSPHMANVEDLVKNTRQDNLFLYWANGGNNEIAMEVCRWFENIEIFDTSDEQGGLQATVSYLEKGENDKKNVLNFMQKADPTIHDFNYDVIEEVQHVEFEGKVRKKSFSKYKSLDLQMIRIFHDENEETIERVHSGIGLESAGTKKMFELAGPIVQALENGAVIFVDEIDAKLHPTLVRFLVMLFNSISENPNNAQLICNTHNALLLEEDIRRDQIYFVEKDKYGRSELYALTDFKGVRKDSKLLKRYLIGAFGATPKLRDHFPSKLSQEAACEQK